MPASRESCDGKASAPKAGWAPSEGRQHSQRAAVAALAPRSCSAGSYAKGASVIASGRYIQVGHSGSFDMVRRNSTVWITDPDGFVTKVDDARIGSLSG